MDWLDFALGVLFLAFVPFWLAAYGGHVAAEAITDPKRQRSVKVRFWGIGLLGVLVAIAYQYRAMRADDKKQKDTNNFQTFVTGQFGRQGSLLAALQTAKKNEEDYHSKTLPSTTARHYVKPSLKQRAFELSAAILQHLASREFFARTPAFDSQSFEHDASMWVTYDRQTVEEYKEKFESAVRKIRDEFATQGLTDKYVQQFTNTDPANSTSVRVLAEGIGKLAKQLKD